MISKGDLVDAARIAFHHKCGEFDNYTSEARAALKNPDRTLRDIWRSSAAYVFSSVEFAVALPYETAANVRAMTSPTKPDGSLCLAGTALRGAMRVTEDVFGEGLRHVRRARLKSGIPYAS